MAVMKVLEFITDSHQSKLTNPYISAQTKAWERSVNGFTHVKKGD